MNAPTKIEKAVLKSTDKIQNAARLRVGIAGAGLMGKWHANAVKKNAGEILAIVDAVPTRAQILGAKYPTAQIFKTVTEMLAAQQPLDVLHVCTPLHNHYEIAEAALKRGINVLIEKPLAATAAETARLYDLAATNQISLCPVHQFAFQHGVAKVKKLVSRIGQIVHLQAVICSTGGSGVNSERQSPDKLEEISSDIIPHPLSLFQTFLKGLLVRQNFSVHPSCAGELRVSGYSEEISLSIFISLNARPPVNVFQIFGTNGTIHLDLFHDFAFIENGKASKLKKILHPFESSVKNFSAAFFNLMQRSARLETAYPGLQILVGSFYRSLRENAPPPISADQTINIAQIRDFIIQHRKLI